MTTRDDEGPAPAAQDGGTKEPAGHVTVLRQGERAIHIVGTAHVSRSSVEEVGHVIAQLRPHTVCVELCQTRYEALTDEARWRKLDIFQVIKQKKALYLLASLALQAYQQRLGARLGVRPGAELLAAIAAAEAVGAAVVLADRNIQTTLKRTWGNLSFWSKSKLLGALLASAFDREQVTEEQIEALKDSDYVSDLMAELARLLPEVKEPLIDERDRYLMSAIEEAPGNTIVAVVGAGHVAGMASCFGGKTDRAALERVPPPSRLMTAVKWAIPAMILAAFYYGYRHHPGGDFWHMLYAWILPTALLGGLGTALAGGKPLSILSALLASPLTTLNPTIAAGMVVGLVEAWLRRPTVADCEKLAEDTLSWRGMYRNPFTRVLLVALGSTIGAALGAWVGTAWVLTLL